jgi:hypothetical protein
MTRTVLTAIFTLSLLLSAFAPQSSYAAPSKTLDVRVTNFPEIQEVKGTVSIEGMTGHSRFIKKEGILVPPSSRNELSELTFSGFVDTDGFTTISANVHGEVKSALFSSGTIGVLLVPDEEPIMLSLRNARRVPFPIENTATIKSGGSSYFDSKPTQQIVAFPRYRIFLYNTINKTVDANVYLYLSK